MGLALVSMVPADASEPPLRCDFVLQALGTISLSELERAIASDRPLEPRLDRCLERADAPARLIDAVRRRLGRAPVEQRDGALEVDVDASDWPEEVGKALADQVRLLAPGERPLVVQYDGAAEGAALPWWYLSLRDRVAARLLARLPEGSQAADHPEVLDEAGPALLDPAGRLDAERRLARMGYRRTLVLTEMGVQGEGVQVSFVLRELNAQGFGRDLDGGALRIRRQDPLPPSEPEPEPVEEPPPPSEPPADTRASRDLPSTQRGAVAVRAQLGIGGYGGLGAGSRVTLSPLTDESVTASGGYALSERVLAPHGAGVRVPVAVVVAWRALRGAVTLGVHSPVGAGAWWTAPNDTTFQVAPTWSFDLSGSLQGGGRLGPVGLYGGVWGGGALSHARVEAVGGGARGGFRLRGGGGVLGPHVSVDVELNERWGLTADGRVHMIAGSEAFVSPYASGGLSLWVRLR